MTEREQAVSRDANGDVLGVALFIDADDLPALADSETVTYRVDSENERIEFVTDSDE